MFTRMRLIVFLMMLLPPGVANANVLTTERTETTLISEVKTIHQGDKFWVALHIQMKPGWHTYWSNPGDSGVTPQLKWTLPNGFMAGTTQYIAPDRERVGPLMDYAYEDNAYYLVQMTPPPILREGTTAIIALKASWLVCKDICIPESGEVSLALPAAAAAEPGDDAPLMSQLVGRLPLPVARSVTFQVKDKKILFELPLKDTDTAPERIKNVLFFPESEDLIANAAEQHAEVTSDKVLFVIGAAEGKIADTASGVVSFYFKDNTRRDYTLRLQSEKVTAHVDALETRPVAPQAAPPPAPPAEQVTLVTAVWYALIGGLILNCMPCVFPILSLKALAVARKAQAHPADARKQGIAYTAGVVASFLLLSFVLLLAQKSGQAAGWGYQMQSPVFVTLLALLLFTVGLNLAGYFELPVILGNVGGNAVTKDNAWGSFLTGVLAVMVATPCTAPFMAPAIGFALTQQSAITVFAVFGALGLGLSLPFLLVSFFPRLIRALPKPGAWMVTFKEFLSFPMFGWTIWLVWLVAREAGSWSACVVLFGMVLIAFAFWLWRQDSGFVKILSLAAAAIAIGVSLTAAEMPMPETGSTTAALQSVSFSPQKLDALRKSGKAVFVDATADWCLICKVNETVALSSPKVVKAFADKQVAYMVADWTHGDEAITRYLESFGRSGVPIYVYYASGASAPVILPQVLTPAAVLEALQ